MQQAKMLAERDGSKPNTRKRRSQLKLRGESWLIERVQRPDHLFDARARLARRKVGGRRDWAAMPGECLSVIFAKLGPINILLTAQFVCRSWQQAAHDPLSWRCADFTKSYIPVFLDDDVAFDDLVKAAVDRSRGSMEEFSFRYFVEDDTLIYMAQRSRKLKRVHLAWINHKGIVELFKLCPFIEDVEIDFYVDDLFDDMQNSHWPSMLKRFHLNGEADLVTSSMEIDDTLAVCIASNIPELRDLRLWGIRISNDGLRAILEGCPQLESLHIGLCYDLDLDEDLKKWRYKIKKFWGPYG